MVAVIAEMKEAERSIWKEDNANLIAKNRKATLKNLKTGNESSVKTEDLANEIKKLL